MENDVVEKVKKEKKVEEPKVGLSRKDAVTKGYKSIKVYVKQENRDKILATKMKHNFVGFDTTVDYILDNWRE